MQEDEPKHTSEFGGQKLTPKTMLKNILSKEKRGSERIQAINDYLTFEEAKDVVDNDAEYTQDEVEEARIQQENC